MPHDPYKALYLHVPFCKSRCNYCDFTTRGVAPDDPRIDQYVERLITEVRRLSKAEELGAIETVYLGGGTPSYLGSRRLTSLLYALGVSLDLTRDSLEFTMEANPESLDERLVRDIWALGVNRLSLGVQSFDDALLSLLGRPHNAEDARRALEYAKDRFENISVDLICGIPGQTDRSLEASLEEAVAAGVSHVSVYPLSIESGTPLDRQVLRGEMEPCDDEAQARQMLLAESLLTSAGYHRYEVASYSLEGFECRHNTAYWSGVPYLGVGEAAATMTQNDERRMRLTNGQVTDDLNRRQMEAEDLMLAMRMTRGVSEERISAARPYLPGLDQTLDSLIERGLITHDQQAFRPTRQGWLYGNELYGAFFDLGES